MFASIFSDWRTLPPFLLLVAPSMDASAAVTSAKFAAVRARAERRTIEPDTDALKEGLLRKGVFPTPKIVRTLRKKEIQKAIRKSKKKLIDNEDPSLSEAERQLQEEEIQFRTISSEYRAVKEELRRRNAWTPALRAAGKPWEKSRSISGAEMEYTGGRLKNEHLVELAEMLAERNSEDLNLLLEEDVEELPAEKRRPMFLPSKMNREEDKIRFLVKRLSAKNMTIQDWKFFRIMKLSGLLFTERNLLKIIGELDALGNWRQAIDTVEWVYSRKENKPHKSRYVYTKLLSVLGKSRKPTEALAIFTLMQEDYQIYPDMAAYHSIAVTLGQAGFLKELVNVVDSMKTKPTKRPKNLWRKDWDPCLQPDIVIYNAMLNACVAAKQWKGVYWIFDQIRYSGLRPNGATYGLAMEVMLESGKYQDVHKIFDKMQRSGTALKAITYKVLVRTLWKEGKIDEAIESVRDMEERGIVGSACVYYELACCLCNHGRWKEALMEVKKMKRLALSKPLEVAFTGMIQSSMDGGHFSHCTSIFEHMKDHCTPNIGTINAMLRVYDRSDMFSKARDLFESAKRAEHGPASMPDFYSYRIMLEASANAHQWEYFEYLYREITLSGFSLDHGIHMWLLLEASRAGKWHLLEHAFDAILEDGDVPHVSLFTEMIIQNLVREEYTQAIKLVNCMAHASISFSDRQWVDFFSKNTDRMDQTTLQKFRQSLDSNYVVGEEPILSLLNSLEFICRSNPSVNPSRHAPVADLEGVTSASGDDFPVEEYPSYDPCAQSVTDAALDSLTADIDFYSDSEPPSAFQILDSWREKRMKHSMYAKFQI